MLALTMTWMAACGVREAGGGLSSGAQVLMPPAPNATASLARATMGKEDKERLRKFVEAQNKHVYEYRSGDRKMPVVYTYFEPLSQLETLAGRGRLESCAACSAPVPSAASTGPMQRSRAATERAGRPVPRNCPAPPAALARWCARPPCQQHAARKTA